MCARNFRALNKMSAVFVPILVEAEEFRVPRSCKRIPGVFDLEYHLKGQILVCIARFGSYSFTSTQQIAAEVNVL